MPPPPPPPPPLGVARVYRQESTDCYRHRRSVGRSVRWVRGGRWVPVAGGRWLEAQPVVPVVGGRWALAPDPPKLPDPLAHFLHCILSFFA